MSELVLRSAMERLQSSMLSEVTSSPLDPSISKDLNFIVKELNRMIVLLKGMTQDKDKVRQIDELSYYIKDAIESPTTWRLINRFKNMILDLKLKKMKTIIRQIEDGLAIPSDKPDEHNNNIVGLDEDRSRLVYNLLSSSSSSLSVSSSSHFGVPVFPICGGAGSGKTTLAKLVFDDLNVGKRFRIRIWINVLEKFEIGRIVKQIIDCGHEWISFFSKEDQVEQIKKILSSERSLIVLDDIRSIEAWETLCKILPRLFEGSYVLVTTRVIHVAENISPKQFVHNMKPLNERDSLALFTELCSSEATTTTTTTSSTETDSGFETSFRLANLSSDTDTDNNRERGMIKEMVRCCKGSPQLIKDLALYLKSKRREEWEMVVRDIPAHLSEFCCRVYNGLPDHLKPCFMYLGHFLEDEEIDLEKLSHLWMIESLLSTRENARGGEGMMDMTERYLRELALMGILEVQAEEVPAASGGSNKLKACRFIQDMEDFCVSNCEHKGFLKIVDLRHEDYSLSSTKEGPARLVIYLGKHKVHIPRRVAKNIRSLRVVLLGNQQQQVTKLTLKLEDYQGLRILDFDRIDFQREKLPSGIFNLKHLRYLSFKGCILDELQSSITNLSYLQVLDLRVEYRFVKMIIPSFLGKMQRLKHLYLPQRFTTQNGEKLRLDGLTELETLVNFNTRVCRANDVSKLCKLEHLTAKVEENFDDFESITNYMKTSSSSNNWRSRLHCSVDIVDLDCYSEERHSVLQEFLQCKVLGTLNSKGFIGRLPQSYGDEQISQNLTQLVLNESYLKEDPMPTLGKLPRLAILVLSDDAYMGKKMVCSASGFPQLKCLQLLNLSSLETLEVHHTSMPQMNNCPKLHKCNKLLEILITHSHRGAARG